MMMLERVLPYNLEVETCLLGAIVLDGGGKFDEISAIVSADDFFRDSHATVFRLMSQLHSDGIPIDRAILMDKMRQSGEFEDDDVIETVGTWAYETPHSANAIYHAHIVRGHAECRRVIAFGHRLIKDAYSGEFSGEQLISRAQQGSLALDTGVPSNTTGRIDVAAERALLKARNRRMGEMVGLPTGLADLDAVIDGLHQAQLIVVAARPSMGKSSLALNIAEYAAAEWSTPAYFATLEMTSLEIGERTLASRTRIDHQRLQTGRLTDNEFGRLENTVKKLRASGELFIDDTASQSISQVVAAARRHKAQHNIGLVVVDYIQLLEVESEEGRQSRQEMVAKVSRRLKLLSRALNVPVIALSQLNRKSEAREDRRPMLGDLRESGAIEQDADVVILIHRPEYYDENDQPGVAELIVAKNRGGPKSTVKVAWVGNLMRFEDLAAPAFE